MNERTRQTGRRRAIIALSLAGLAGLAGLATLAILPFAFVGCGEPSPPSPPPPQKHVLLVTVDTTRADRLGCYGYPRPITPCLDALAGEGALFEMAIAQAAVTPVSHASILTGLDPHHHRLRVLHGHEENTLAPEQTTLAEVWRQAGGKAAAFVSAYPVTADFGLDQGFDHFDARFLEADRKGLVNDSGMVNTASSQRRADATTDAAIAWLNAQGDPAAPLFLWVHYFDPHDAALLPPREVLERFPPRSLEKDQVLRDLYDVEMFYMDSQIGRLLEAFKARGLWDETVTAVVSDHGEGLGDHGWWSHGILYQEQIRVPLIVRVPGGKAGLRIPSLVRTIDLMPTILEAAAVHPDLHPPMDGESLVAALESGELAAPRRAYSDSVNIISYGRPDVADRRDRKVDKLYCLMTGTHKLIYHQLMPERTEFYDLVADPLETVNLAREKPAAMRELMKALEEYKAFSDIMPDGAPTDVERLRQLEGLGYR